MIMVDFQLTQRRLCEPPGFFDLFQQFKIFFLLNFLISQPINAHSSPPPTAASQI